AMNSRRVTTCADRSATIQLLFRVYHGRRIDDGAPAHSDVPILEALARPMNDDGGVDLFGELRDFFVLRLEKKEAYALRAPGPVQHRWTSMRQPCNLKGAQLDGELPIQIFLVGRERIGEVVLPQRVRIDHDLGVHGVLTIAYFRKMAFGSIACTPFVPSTTCVTY